MHRPGATLALLLLAAGAAGAAEPEAAPLENSKQALKALQADQAAKNSAVTAGKLTDALPAIDAPAPGSSTLEFAPAKKPETETKEKGDRPKNWLLDGVDKLERSAKAKGRPADAAKKDVTAGDETEDNPDSSDPDYLLKVYTKQRQEADVKAAETRTAAATHNDPFAPFLQDWLGNSPARGKFFDDFTHKGDTPAGLAIASGPSGPGSNPVLAAASDDNHGPAAGAAPNPYLQNLDLPGAAGPAAGPNNQPATVPAASGVPAMPPATAPLDPPPAVQPVEKRPALLVPSDNEKYFPQQKKF